MLFEIPKDQTKQLLFSEVNLSKQTLKVEIQFNADDALSRNIGKPNNLK